MSLICKCELNNFKGTDFSCMFNIGRFSLINSDSAILLFQELLLKFLAIIFKIVITKVCMSKFYRMYQNM